MASATDLERIKDVTRCAMCGSIKTADGCDVPPDRTIELLDELQEIWLACGEKALDLIFARKTFPHASQRNIAEFLGISPATVCRTIKEITAIHPDTVGFLQTIRKKGYQGNHNASKGKTI